MSLTPNDSDRSPNNVPFSKEPERPFNESRVDNTLIGMANAEIREAILDRASELDGPFNRITPENFEGKLQELLNRNIPDHLRIGLGILSGILAKSENSLETINEKDGAQMLVQLLITYMEEHADELAAVVNQHPSLKGDIEDFIKAYERNGSPQELRNHYLAQLAHFAFHMIYYGYEPLEEATLDQHSNHRSFLTLTKNASLITASHFGGIMAQVQYHRLNKRDMSAPSSPLSILEGRVPVPVGTKVGHSLDIKPFMVKGNGNPYSTFSTSRILAAKKEPISRYEEGNLGSFTTTLSISFLGKKIE